MGLSSAGAARLWWTLSRGCGGVLVCSFVIGLGCAGSVQSSSEPVAPEARCGDERCSVDAGESVSGCPVDCFDAHWVELAGGEFMMGDDEGLANERPSHLVRVEAFRLMKREVTTDEYRVCVRAKACAEPTVDSRDELTPPEYCTWLHDDRGEHPINCISWAQAKTFCEWVGARLPTEAEWEFAARSGGRDIAYPWGDDRPSCERAVMGAEPHFVGCREERTFPVCSKTPGNSEQGICDLAGSVMEWVEDAGHESYEGAPADGSAWLDDVAPETRIARGGSLVTRDTRYLRSTVRFLFDPEQPRYVVGLRCAR